jgi:hypothetical protein
MGGEGQGSIRVRGAWPAAADVDRSNAPPFVRSVCAENYNPGLLTILHRSGGVRTSTRSSTMTASGMAVPGRPAGRRGAPPRPSTSASAFLRPPGTHTMRSPRSSQGIRRPAGSSSRQASSAYARSAAVQT